jgi:hypothetical protein
VRYLKFRPLSLAPGKAKTGASAAFLGVLPICLQKDVSCCVNVTKHGANSPPSGSLKGAGGVIVHTPAGHLFNTAFRREPA